MILLSGRLRGRRELNTRDDRGATAAEYALMVSLIALVIFAGVFYFGQSVKALFVLITTSPPFA